MGEGEGAAGHDPVGTRAVVLAVLVILVVLAVARLVVAGRTAARGRPQVRRGAREVAQAADFELLAESPC
jgi:Sec-independent protein translocase protein TatA